MSVLDVGCGLGYFCSAFLSAGVPEVYGVDGSWVPDSMLRFPRHCFVQHDLEKPLDLGRRFDIVISLEVAEHINAKAADVFVRSLAAHADRIVFSAAFPGQGGQNHLNEQWSEYWLILFKQCGYLPVDILRSRLLCCETIPHWYRYNTMVFIRHESGKDLPLATAEMKSDFLQYVISGKLGVRLSLRALVAALRRIKTRNVLSYLMPSYGSRGRNTYKREL